MSRKENDDFVATKAEKTFDDEGNTLVAELPKSKMKDEIKVKQIKSEVKPGVVKFKNSDIAPGKFSYRKLLNKKIN